MFQFQIEALREAAIADVVDRYLQELRRRGYSPQSITAYSSIFRRFVCWCDQQEIKTVLGLNEQTMATYQAHLTDRINSNAPKRLRRSTRAHHLYTLGRIFQWMRSEGIIDIDPMSEMEISSKR